MDNIEGKNKEELYKTIKWGFIAILAIFLTTCGYNSLKEYNSLKKPINEPKEVIKVTHDTVWSKADTIYSFETKKKFIYLIDTVYKPVLVTSEECNKTKLSIDTLDNSQITIYDSIYYQGILRKKHTAYKLKVPLMITDSVFIAVPKPIVPEYQVNAGLAVGSNLLAPTVAVTKGRHTVGLGYNVQNKQPIVEYKFRLWSSKK